jgi:hypothetical protein
LEAALLQQEIKRDLSTRKILKMAWGVITLKLHHSKSKLRSTYKRLATFHQIRGKPGRAKLTSTAL